MRNRLLSRLAATAFCTLVLHAPVFAGEYYVSVLGSDSNPGTQALPWRTIQKAASILGPGDTLFIRQGIYHETVTPANSGTEGNYITYSRYGSEQVLIDADSRARDTCISVIGKGYLQFLGLNLTGAASAAFLAMDNAHHLVLDGLACYKSRYGIRLYGREAPVTNVTVRNCQTYDNSKYGIFLYKRVYDSKIGPGNHVYNNGGEDQSYGIEIGTDYPGNQADGARRIIVAANEVNNNQVQGIRTWNAVGINIAGNYCHHNGATGIQVENGSSNIIVEANRCEYNALAYEYETGIWIDGTQWAIARSNIVANNAIGMMVSSSSGVILRNNVVSRNNGGTNPTMTRGINIRDSSSDVVVIHNTVYRNGTSQSAKGAISVYQQIRSVLKNNILAETLGPIDLWVDGGCVSDGNVVYNLRPLAVSFNGSEVSWEQYRSASGQDAHSVTRNPMLVNPDQGDFTLAASSPAVNSGVRLTETRTGGSGTSIPVTDARYFTDGFGVGMGDLIRVGKSGPVRITHVDHANNSVSVEKELVWAKGDGVSLDYLGSASDIGAIEYGTSSEPGPGAPSGLTVVLQ